MGHESVSYNLPMNTKLIKQEVSIILTNRLEYLLVSSLQNHHMFPLNWIVTLKLDP